MSASSSSSPPLSSASCTNKREVLDRVKEVLETYVQSGVIDREDFKRLAKKSMEAVAPPIAVEEVRRCTLQQLENFLSESGAEEDVVSSIRDAAKAIAPVKPLPQAPQAQAVSTPAPAFSLSALQVRMTRKREELRRHREEAPVKAEEMPRPAAPASASNAPSASAAQATSVTETRHSSMVDEEEAPSRKHKSEAPAPVSISLPALQDVDLYADFIGGAPGPWHPPLQLTPM